MSRFRAVAVGLLAASGLASAQLVVTHHSASATPASQLNEIKPELKLLNTGSTTVNLSQVAVDYLVYETGLPASALVPVCYSLSVSSCSDFLGEVASIPVQQQGSKAANFRIRITFLGGALASGKEAVLQWGLRSQGIQHVFDETDDWSYTSGNGLFNVAPGVAVSAVAPPSTAIPMFWTGNVTSLPSTGTLGGVARNTAQGATYLWDGAVWPVFAVGQPGPQGLQGLQGIQGAIGPRGDAGPKGIAGPKGPAGVVGPAGDPGPRGYAGIDGIDGPTTNIDALQSQVINLRLKVQSLMPAANARIVAVEAGANHSLELAADGTLWANGAAIYGQIGDGTNQTHLRPVQVLTGVASVSAGLNHTLAVKADGTLWATGSNTNGQFGIAPGPGSKSFVQVLTGVKAASAGMYHSLVLKTDGTVWGAGMNANGQLGQGTSSPVTGFVQIMPGSTFAKISAGDFHSLLVKLDGTAWATGLNSNGQIGSGPAGIQTTPVQVLTGVANVAAGGNHSLFLRNDGTVWGCGLNGYGQLGGGSSSAYAVPTQFVQNVKAIAAGNSHSLFLMTNNTLWGVGWNNHGQLGNGTLTDPLAPIVLPVPRTWLLDGVRDVSAGFYSTLVLKLDGSVWSTGWNNAGQLGDGGEIDRAVPVKVQF